MKIGIISKEEHAKVHARRLRTTGHVVRMLGGSPNEIPPTIEVIVCRISSSSHCGFETAKAAERAGRTVIFEDSVTGILEGVESLTQEQDQEQEEKKEMSTEDSMEDKTPVRGVLHRAYWNRNHTAWQIRSGAGWSAYHGEFKGSRSAVEAEVARLDAQKMARGENMTAGPVKTGPVKAPPPPKKVASEPEVEVSVVSEPETEPAPEPEPEPEAQSSDLATVLSLLAEEMDRQGILTWHDEALGLTVHMTQMHQVAPIGVTCNQEGSRRTSDFGKVTCKVCQQSSFWATAQWVMENMATKVTS